MANLIMSTPSSPPRQMSTIKPSQWLPLLFIQKPNPQLCDLSLSHLSQPPFLPCSPLFSIPQTYLSYFNYMDVPCFFLSQVFSTQKPFHHGILTPLCLTDLYPSSIFQFIYHFLRETFQVTIPLLHVYSYITLSFVRAET